MFDLATAKTRLGIVGTLQDTQLNVAIGAALNIAEKYCDRNFLYMAETARFYYSASNALKVRRYPIESVTSVTDTKNRTPIASTDYKVDLKDGMILFSGWRFAEEIDVSYTGGYKTLPDDLELALWSIFDNVWATLPGGGLTIGATAGSGGTIKSIAIPDVGTVQYDTSSGAGGGAGSGAGGKYITDGVRMLLDLYRAESAVGAG
jgi:hypothetical protein